MERNNKRGSQSKEYMEVQPMPGESLLRKPFSALTQRIQEDDEEHAEASEAKLQPDHPAGLQQNMLRRKWTIRRRERVIVEPVNRQSSHQNDGDHITRDQKTVVSAVFGWNRYGGSCDCGVGTHLVATCSSVLTENRL